MSRCDTSIGANGWKNSIVAATTLLRTGGVPSCRVRMQVSIRSLRKLGAVLWAYFQSASICAASIGGENNASTESGASFRFSGNLDEVGVYKPHAEIFRHALDGLGVDDPAGHHHRSHDGAARRL